jgi:UDP:flavonoid glycosyltransferase YjiC (YdhE family)
MGRDQGDNAARVAWRGAGIRCSSKADAKTLRRAIQQLLEQPRFRAGARQIAAGISRDGGSATAIAELEGLASPLALASESE